MPGDGNSVLRVERTELENTGMLITSAARGIGEAIADAARRINALDGNWTGMSNEKFMPEFNQSRTRAAAVSDGLTRLGKNIQEIGGNYETADNVPLEFDMNIEQDASGKTSMAYSFVDGNSGEGAHAYNQFEHNGDGTVAVDMQEVGISANGEAQMSHVHLSEENFNTGGYEPDGEHTSMNAELVQNGDWAKMAEARGFPISEGGAASPLSDAPTGQQERLQGRVENALGGLPLDRPQQSLEERIVELNEGAGDVLDQVKNGELPTDAVTPDSPRASGGGGGSIPMQMSPLPPLQQQPSTLSADLLKSADPPAGYKEGNSLSDLMTAMAMDNMMDDSPLDRGGGGGIGGFSGETPQGVGTMDLTDSMQTLTFPGQEVALGAPDLDVDPTAENPLAGIEQDFFEKPREMKINNVNPRDATKD
jgi:WXG100 family type VII secretion target